MKTFPTAKMDLQTKIFTILFGFNLPCCDGFWRLWNFYRKSFFSTISCGGSLHRINFVLFDDSGNFCGCAEEYFNKKQLRQFQNSKRGYSKNVEISTGKNSILKTLALEDWLVISVISTEKTFGMSRISTRKFKSKWKPKNLHDFAGKYRRFP